MRSSIIRINLRIYKKREGGHATLKNSAGCRQEKIDWKSFNEIQLLNYIKRLLVDYCVYMYVW